AELFSRYFQAKTYCLCDIFSAAPPVTFSEIPEEDLFKSVVEQEELVLSCEVSRADGVVQWYKDGIEMQQSNKITIKAEGPYRRLKIISSGVEDSGEYVCDTADDSIFFHLTITVIKTYLCLFFLVRAAYISSSCCSFNTSVGGKGTVRTSGCCWHLL
uniref:Ig-like domain-containing protein n=1 Tax=Labrus bergylta TaxID=56723 RepID=A0A3Q3LJW8_9LABR